MVGRKAESHTHGSLKTRNCDLPFLPSKTLKGNMNSCLDCFFLSMIIIHHHHVFYNFQLSETIGTRPGAQGQSTHMNEALGSICSSKDRQGHWRNAKKESKEAAEKFIIMKDFNSPHVTRTCRKDIKCV